MSLRSLRALSASVYLYLLLGGKIRWSYWLYSAAATLSPVQHVEAIEWDEFLSIAMNMQWNNYREKFKLKVQFAFLIHHQSMKLMHGYVPSHRQKTEPPQQTGLPVEKRFTPRSSGVSKQWTVGAAYFVWQLAVCSIPTWQHLWPVEEREQ